MTEERRSLYGEPFDVRIHARVGGLLHQVIEVYIYDMNFVDIDKGIYPAIATEICFERKEPWVEPTSAIRLTTQTAQELMDSLWNCGLRPTQGKGTAGQLEAVKYHLEDMRRLVYEYQTRITKR